MKAPSTYIKPAEVANIHHLKSFPAHMVSNPGVLDMDLHPIHENFVLSGGKDSQAIL